MYTISPPGFIPHTVLFPLDTSIPILSMGIPSFLIKYCNASAPAYYDSIWFVTRTRHSRSNLLNRIFITRGRRTVYSSNAWLTKETVHPLPSHYNKNKHSLRGFLSASDAMLILYQTMKRDFQAFKNRTAVTKEERLRQRKNCAAIVKDKAARLRGANDNFLITVRLSGSFVPLVTV